MISKVFSNLGASWRAIDNGALKAAGVGDKRDLVVIEMEHWVVGGGSSSTMVGVVTEHWVVGGGGLSAGAVKWVMGWDEAADAASVTYRNNLIIWLFIIW